MEKSKNKEAMIMHKKPAKITCHIIEAVYITKAKLDAKAVAFITSNVLQPTSKCKLKHKGA